MFCSFCGKEISDSAKFCPFCGAGAQAPAAPAANEVKAVEAAHQSAPQSAPQQGIRCPVCGHVFANNTICPHCGWMMPVVAPGPGTTWADVTAAEKQAKSKKKKTGLIIGGSILGGIAFLALLAVLAFNFVLPKMGLYGDFYDIMDEAGEAYDYEEDVEKAQKLLDRAYRAAADDSERAEVWQARGIIAYLEGDEEEAAEHLRKAIDLDAWTAELYLMLATCYMDMGDEDTALDVLMEGWEKFPGDGGIEQMLWEEFGYEGEMPAQEELEPEPEAPVAMPEVSDELPDTLRVMSADTDPMFDLALTLGIEMGYNLGLEPEVSGYSDSYSALFALESGETDVLILTYTDYDCQNYGFPDFIYTDPFCDFGGLEYAMILRPDSEALRDELNALLRDYKESGYLADVLAANLPDAMVP